VWLYVRLKNFVPAMAAVSEREFVDRFAVKKVKEEVSHV
jgi:hypothetical protein